MMKVARFIKKEEGGMRAKQKGFSAVEAVLIIVIVGIIGFAGWFVWNSQKQTSKTLEDANKSSNATNVTKESDASANSPNTTAKTEVNYAVIREWGVKVKLSDAEKVTFTVSNTKGTYAGVFDYDGVAKPTFLPQYLQDKTCEPGVSLYRFKEAPEGFNTKKIGDYQYAITGGPGSCSPNPDTNPDDILKSRFLLEFTVDKVEAL